MANILVIAYSFVLGFHLSGVTLTPITDKRETSVGILDYNNICFGSDGSNWLTRVQLLVTLCVLVDYLVVLSISALGDTYSSFAINISSLGDTESISDSLSFKSFLDCYLSTGALGWNLVLL